MIQIQMIESFSDKKTISVLKVENKLAESIPPDKPIQKVVITNYHSNSPV